MSDFRLGPARELSGEAVAAKMAKSRKAAALWCQVGVAQRTRILDKVWASLNDRRAEGLAIIREELGRGRLEIELGEFGSAALLVDYFSRNAQRILGDRCAWLPWFLFNKRATVRRLPRGVVGVIASSRLPFLTPFSDAYCAMLAGNSVLLKPSEWATRSALWLEGVVEATGALPEGLLTVIPGGAAAGEMVVDSADMVLFSGSTQTGRSVAARAAARLKPTALDLGGKHPMVICADACVERTAAAAAWAAFAAGGLDGARGVCAYVESKVYDRFVEQVKAVVAELKPGVGAVGELGRWVVPSVLEAVQRLLDEARGKGATVLGGQIVDPEDLRMAPALVLGATAEMGVMFDDAPGPVLPVMKVERAEEAVALANVVSAGGSASVWSADWERAERLAASIDAGAIGINEPGPSRAIGSLPFGGVKSGGYGRRHGDEGLLALTQAQSILTHEWPAELVDPWWFPRDPRIVRWMRRRMGLSDSS